MWLIRSPTLAIPLLRCHIGVVPAWVTPAPHRFETGVTMDNKLNTYSFGSGTATSDVVVRNRVMRNTYWLLRFR